MSMSLFLFYVVYVICVTFGLPLIWLEWLLTPRVIRCSFVSELAYYYWTRFLYFAESFEESR